MAVIAVCAFGGGYYGMSGAEGVPRELLEGSPFRTYFAPSLILFAAVGGSFLFAAIGVLFHRPFARVSTNLAAVVATVWIAAQVAIIGYVSWLQPAVVGVAMIVLLLNRLSSTRPALSASSKASLGPL